MLAKFVNRLLVMFSVINTNWKYKILIILPLIFMAVAFMILPSQPDSIAKSSYAPNEGRVVLNTNGKALRYANDVYEVAPENFAVTQTMLEIEAAAENVPNNEVRISPKKAAQIRRNKEYDEARDKKGLPPLTDSEREEREINQQNGTRVKKIIPGAGLGTDNFIDSLAEKALKNDSPQTMPLPSLTFDGATSADNVALGIGLVAPPDVNGDVGPNHYVSSVNLALKVFNKSGSVVAGPIKTSNLWTALPAGDPCRSRNDGDPIVVYDSLADRWFITQFSIPGFRNGSGSNYECIAVSTTPDPTGSYFVWSYVYPAPLLNDYPKVGVWTDAYHITFNQFNGSSAFSGTGILSQDRTKALVGDPTTSVVFTNLSTIDANAGGTLPADIDGIVPPPLGMAQVIAEFRANELGNPIDAIRYYKWIPDFNNPANSTISILPDVQLAEFDARQLEVRGAIEVQDGFLLDAIADRLMNRLAYRNLGTVSAPINSITGNFTVNVSGVNPTTPETYQAGIRWFEMRRTNDSFSVFDQGTQNSSPGNGATGINNWMGSIAQDHQGNLALGFSQAGTTQNADIKIAGRTNNVANSGTLNEGEALFFDALGSQGGAGSSNRWGDYSSMNVDPLDDCTFWYTQEYYATTIGVGWSTRVGKFKFPGCTAAPKSTISGTITSCSSGLPINNASVNATGGFNRLSISNGTYSMTVAPGTYTVGANKTRGFIGTPQTTTVANGATANVNICLIGVPVVSDNVSSTAIVGESCGIANGSPDPGETVTVNLPISNIGGANTVNLTATLRSTGGVNNPSPTQSYGTLAASGSAISRNFTFQVNPAITCGNQITLTWDLQDGSTNLGILTKTYITGTPVFTFTENFDGVVAPNLPTGWTQTQLIGTSTTWTTSTTVPNSSPNSLLANDPETTNLTVIETPAFPVSIPNAVLSFQKAFDSDSGFDGVALEIKIGNGAWTDILVSGGTFVSGEYNGFISNAFGGNPLEDRRAWTGLSPTFSPTVITLPASANGQNVKLRWLMGSDVFLAGNFGFKLDDVRVATNVACNTNCSAIASRLRSDFDGDGKSDLSVFRPSLGNWYLNRSTTGFTVLNFGIATDSIIPGDFDGDGKTDAAVFRPSNAASVADFYVLKSGNNTLQAAEWGIIGDLPTIADFDGDNKDDFAIYRPSSNTYFVIQSTNNVSRNFQFGIAGDIPIPGDFDGDNKAEFAVFRPSNGTWYYQTSSAATFTAVNWGIATDIPVFADYDGDGKDDIAVFRPSNGFWYINKSSGGTTFIQWGTNGDVPVPGDFDGDGKYDQAVYRAGTWYLNGSTSGFVAAQFGVMTDRPTLRYYLP
jgi:FG-GAP-like repeat